MGTGSFAMSAPRITKGGIPTSARALRLLVLTMIMGVAFAVPAPALASNEGPVYTLKVTEGETTLPEYSIVQTSGSVEGGSGIHSAAISITRGGVVIERGKNEHEPSTSTSQVPQVGDVLTLEAPIGTVVGSVVYDGLPSMDPTVCAGSTNFSGQNSPDETVRGSYFTETLHVEKYSSYPEQVNSGRAQVTALTGTSFGGSFLAPLQLGQTVSATESLETPLAGNAVFKYVSEN
jgi:hypothetical protein